MDESMTTWIKWTDIGKIDNEKRIVLIRVIQPPIDDKGVFKA